MLAVALNNWYRESENSKVWWLDNPNEIVLAFSFDKKTIYYLPRDYRKLTDEQREILDKETGNFWRDYFNY